MMDVVRGTVPRVSQGNLVGECVLRFCVEFLGVRVDHGEVRDIFSWTRPGEISSQRRSHEFVAIVRTGGAAVQGRLEVLGQSNKGFNVHGANGTAIGSRGASGLQSLCAFYPRKDHRRKEG